ncbi:SUKH-4 family immunity protein [Streptomyces sp. LX-29]|uniref:SUKH-4 family immunity protein n=1 Tax=Streptomyces sp. LX-29 TaxID=2900152 RepID=UPI00240D6178|nr:SUKH-4 family immunity protein [Streptomyces sp. LX-29]WFB07705.1 SUKH-4 family immunity protein [Streptomyces sp. LX-29]
MVTFAQAQERAELWINGEVPGYQQREVRVREFDLGFVAWAEDREGGPVSDSGSDGVRLVIARDSGETTLWPALPVGEVIRRYEEEYGTADEAEPAPAETPPQRVDLNATSFLLTPPQWLQDAADAMGIPDRRSGSTSGGASSAAPAGSGPVSGAVAAPADAVPADAGAGTGQSAGADVWAAPAQGTDGRSGQPGVGPAGPPSPSAQPASGQPAGGPWATPAPAPYEAPGGPSAPGGAPGAAAAAPSSGGMPWAQANSVADDVAFSVVPPATVFAPPLAGSDDEDTPPPGVRPEAKTELMSSGSALPPTTVAPALDLSLQGAGDLAGSAAGTAPVGGAPTPPPLPPPPPGVPGPSAAPVPPPSGPGAPGAPGGGYVPTQLVSALGPEGAGGPGAPGAPGQPGAPGAPGVPGAAGPGVPPPGVPGQPGPLPPGQPGAPGGPGVPAAPGVPAPAAPGAPGVVHAAATMLAGPPGVPAAPGAPGVPAAPGVPGQPGVPGAPGAPAPSGPLPPGVPGAAGPGVPGAPGPTGPLPPGAPGAPGGVHAAATMLAGASGVPGAPAAPGVPGAPGGPGGPGVPGMAPPGPGATPPPGGGAGQPPYGHPQAPTGLPTVGPGYMAVLRYRAQDGSEQQVIRRSAPGTPHPEWQILHELRAMNVPPQQVLELHTELESCDLPGGYCARMIRETWPQVRISHTAAYGRDHATRQQGVRHLIEHQGELHQVADGPARPAPNRVPLPHPNQVQRVPPAPAEALAQELMQAFGPQGVFRFDQRAVSRMGVPDVVAQTLVWAGLPLDFGPFFWAQAQPGRPVPTLAELAAERGVQPAVDAGSYLVMGSDFGRQLCVQYGTAHIVAVPLEAGPGGQPVPPQFVNTGLPEFVRCMGLLGRMWRLRYGLTPEQAGRWTVDFQAQLAALDPAALSAPDNWWSVLLEQMWDGLL